MLEYWQNYCDENAIETGACFDKDDILNGISRTGTTYKVEGMVLSEFTSRLVIIFKDGISICIDYENDVITKVSVEEY